MPPVSSATSQVAPPHRLSAVRCLISRHTTRLGAHYNAGHHPGDTAQKNTGKQKQTNQQQPRRATSANKKGSGGGDGQISRTMGFSHGRGVSDICLFMVEHHSVAHHRNNKQTMWGEGVVTRRKTVANTQHTAIQLPRALSRRSVPCLKW